MKLTKKTINHFVENIESLYPVEGHPQLDLQVENTFFTGPSRVACIRLQCKDGQWWYSVAQPPTITGNPEKITTEEAAEIIGKNLGAVNHALAELPWALCGKE